jgi:peptide/nickel transport system substrate-binding protein
MNRLPLQSVETINQASNVTLGQAPGLTFRMVLFNHNTEPFGVRDVRMAFAKAVDKEIALQAAWFNQGGPAKGPIPEAHSMYSSDLEDHQAFNPDEATSLIEQSDYSVSEINEMGLEVLTWGSGLWYQFSQVVADQVSQNLGIDLGVNSKTFGSTFSDMENQSFDLVSWGYRGFTAADQYMYAYVSDSSRNSYRGYSNEEYDNLVLDARAEMDPESRRDIYLEAQNILGQDAADINLVHADMLEAYRNSVQNYSTSPQTDYAHDFNGVTLSD